MPDPEIAIDDIPHRLDVPVTGLSALDKACEAACSLALVATIVLISMEALARNLFHTSLQITDEIGGYLLVAITFLSLPVAEAAGAFHRVELLQMRLSRRLRLLSQALFDLLAFVAAAAVTWQLTRLALNSWRSEDVAATLLQTPLWIPQSVMGLGMALLCVALLRSLLLKLKRLPMEHAR